MTFQHFVREIAKHCYLSYCTVHLTFQKHNIKPFDEFTKGNQNKEAQNPEHAKKNLFLIQFRVITLQIARPIIMEIKKTPCTLLIQFQPYLFPVPKQ